MNLIGTSYLRTFYLTASLIAAALSYNATAAETEPKIKVLNAFYAALAAEDEAQIADFLTDDAMMIAPYNPNGDASRKGIRSFPALSYLTTAMQTYDNIVFVDRNYSIADDGETVWVEAEGRLQVSATDTPYHNRYVFKVHFDGDKIRQLTEYTNVVTLQKQGVTAL